MGIRIHRLSDYPERRLTISAGDYRVALHVPDDFPDEETFCDAPGLPAALELHIISAPHTLGPPTDGYLQRGPDGYSFESPACRGSVTLSEGRGDFELLQLPPDYTNKAIRPLLDVAMSAILDRVMRCGGLMLHATALRLAGKAYVVCGPSERGKTTLFLRFGRQRAPKELAAAQLGDEWTLVAPDDNGTWHYWWYPYARGPFWPRPATVPLGGVLHLDLNREETAARRLEPIPATALLASSAYFVRGLDTQQVLDHAANLATSVPNALLKHCLTTPTAQVAEHIQTIRPTQ